ncbi:uncharacterized protein LOC108677174 [Hyalella azteca]|uniref:Uncharacterized protein LOC108677174 n=1 Tax=Hyalella azteca TaxID=294128 RepID=A0A8B7P4E8_HYAAZ|nr:uncharacterized protein LOC108677174 [Hyalella azteca]
MVTLAAVEAFTTCYYDYYLYQYDCYQYQEWANWTVGSGGVLCVLVAILLTLAIRKKAYCSLIRAFVGITILVAVGYIVTASILVSENAGWSIFLYCISVWLFIMTGIVAKYGQLMIAVPRAADPAFAVMTNSAPTSQIHVHPQQQTNIINQTHNHLLNLAATTTKLPSRLWLSCHQFQPVPTSGAKPCRSCPAVLQRCLGPASQRSCHVKDTFILRP